MNLSQEYTKPLPGDCPESRPFWQAARRHELVFQSCADCGHKIHFPRCVCPGCLSENLQWSRASGIGSVYSYTIIHRQVAHPCFASEIPYVYAIIELEEGPRMVSNVINIDPEKVGIGMKVRVVFEDVSGKVSIPKFEPSEC